MTAEETDIELEPMETAPRDALGFIAVSTAGHEVPLVWDQSANGFAVLAVSVDPMTGRRAASPTKNFWSKEFFKGWKRQG